MFKSILIPIDGSEHALNAVKTGCKLAVTHKSEVHIIHAPMVYADVIALGYSAATLPPAMKTIEKTAKETMDTAVNTAHTSGVKQPITEIEYGYPTSVIIDYATKNNIDLIVMGRRGLGTLKGLLIGSVTSKVQQMSPCAVLTVK